ncbi:MAG: VOC family protein [Gammaproteobacteria bacterium]
MIGYVTLGTRDLAKARKFYDPVLGLLDAKPTGWTSERAAFYQAGNGPMIAVMYPFDGRPATWGNGSMVALAAPTRQVVDKMHALALSLGGADEGAPGLRGDDPNGFYGAYFRDPDGNKLCIFRMGPP